MAFLLLLVRLLSLLGASSAFLYQPGSPSGKSLGEIWDPSVTWWRGKWYAHAMYQAPGLRTNEYLSGWLATSSDGCHWEDGGAVAPEHTGDQWWKGFVRQIKGDAANLTDDALFIMNHGVDEEGKGNDALRFLTSTDLEHWTENSTSHPDKRWYNTGGRWDHMYMSALDDGSGGFIGFAVSSPTVPGFAGTWPGINRSPDGVRWTQHPPLNVSWGGVGATSIEEGGFEKLRAPDGSEKYYLIGGGGGPAGVGDAYSMWVFSSDKIDGPYSPLTAGFRLSGGSAGRLSGRFGWLAAWCGPNCGNGTPLISNYITPGPNSRADVWMLPMRKPVIDAAGRLRLGYWEANDKLKGKPLLLNTSSTSSTSSSTTSSTSTSASTSAFAKCDGGGGVGQSVVWLSGALDESVHESGAILNLTITASGPATAAAAGDGGSVGIALEDLADRNYMMGTDLPGDDYQWFAVNYTDPHLCKAACEADSSCQAWTYVGSGGGDAPAVEGHGNINGYPVPRCCLKNSTRMVARLDSTCTSGFKNGSGFTSLMVTVGTDGAVGSAAELSHVVGGKASVIDRAAQFKCGGKEGTTTCGVSTVTGVTPNDQHTILVMFRRGMFEVYIDSLLVQSFVYGGAYPLPKGGHGRVGLACSGTTQVDIGGAKLWQMNL